MYKNTIPRTPLSQGILSKTTNETLSENETTLTSNGHVISQDVKSPFHSEDNKDTPRQITPTKSRPASRPKSFTELSLSDVEHESRHNTPKPRLPRLTQEVVVVETKTDNLHESGEVETRSFTAQSPARVVCHSPIQERDGTIPNNESTRTRQSKKSLSFDENNISNVKDLSTGTGKKKKKKFVPVQSRYKQQSSKKAEDVKSKSLEISAITPHPNVQTSAGAQKKSRVTSTPFLMTSMYEGQHADGSILDQTRFQTKEPAIKEPMLKKKSKKDGKRKETGKESIREVKHNEFDGLTLDLQYARLLQMTYLHMKAKQTFDKQEEKAKAEIYGLWGINRKIEKEIEALTSAVNTMKLEMTIDQLLDMQMERSKPLSNKLSKMILKSSRLAEALMDTTHYLPTNYIIQPENEEKVLDALDESKRLLSEIHSLTRKYEPNIENLASTSEVLMKTVKTEVSEQARCSELLAACTTRLNHERSLQVQLLENT